MLTELQNEKNFLSVIFNPFCAGALFKTSIFDKIFFELQMAISLEPEGIRASVLAHSIDKYLSSLRGRPSSERWWAASQIANTSHSGDID